MSTIGADGPWAHLRLMLMHANERPGCRDSGIAIVAPVLSGVLLGASFRADELSPLAWVGLLPIASALKRRSSVIETYFGAYLGGLAFSLMTADWIRTLEGGSG